MRARRVSQGSPIPGSGSLFRAVPRGAIVKDMTNPSPIALITGGSRGLGRATALALADGGADVIITYNSSEAAAREVVAEVEARGRRGAALPLDVGDSATFAAFAETLRGELGERGTFDVLVNNAGTSLHEALETTTERQFDDIFAVHVKGPFFLTQALLGLLADGARIVNVSTGLTRFSFPGSGAYAMAKGAIEVLSRYQALESRRARDHRQHRRARRRADRLQRRHGPQQHGHAGADRRLHRARPPGRAGGRRAGDRRADAGVGSVGVRPADRGLGRLPALGRPALQPRQPRRAVEDGASAAAQDHPQLPGQVLGGGALAVPPRQRPGTGSRCGGVPLACPSTSTETPPGVRPRRRQPASPDLDAQRLQRPDEPDQLAAGARRPATSR